MEYFRSFWPKFFKLNWQFGLLLIFLFGIPRFIIVLNANKTGNYNFTSIIFVFMIILSFLLLSKKGRNYVGIKKPKSFKWSALSFILGILSCIAIFSLAQYAFGDTLNNWFVYISKSFGAARTGLNQDNKLFIFLVFAIISMIFSPFGEEFLYRGIIHKSFAEKFGDNNASVLDSSAFAITHLAHFGIVYINDSWNLLVIPALLWVIIIYFTGRLFHFCKIKTKSVYGAVLCHAGFNLTMIYFIFYHIF